MSTGDMNAAFDRFKQTYFEECAELIDGVYGHLDALNSGRSDAETLNAIFRGIHSIKGGGGAFGFDRLVGFAHHFETLLDLLRSDRVAATPDVVSLLLRAIDALSDLVSASREGRSLAADYETELTGALQAAAQGEGHAPAAAAAPTAGKPAGACVSTGYRIRFYPRTELYRRANEPLLLFRELARLGTLTVEADLSRLPGLDAMDPEGGYLGWTITLDARVPQIKIEEVFEFVCDDCELEIAPLSQDVGIKAQETAAAPPQPAASALQAPQCPSAPAVSNTPASAAPALQSIRVEVDRVDRVVNLVGELVINQSMLRQLGSELPQEQCPELINGLDALSQHLRELQESVMAMRAQPVKSVFSRMPRLVREVAGQLGKDVRLVVTGEATEIDKTVVEQLADPLTHLLRNALDHGVETPEEREAAGKSRQGTIQLSAEHRSSRIVIEVTDDGKGINRERVLAKAQDRGLVAQGAQLTDEEIDNLIFIPSLSTAESVSNISGRGVGMDVVKRNMQALGGRIAVESKPGKGSKFTLSLPLTLAVLDAMTVAVGEETYLIPLTNIMESLRPERAKIHPVVGRGDVLAIRGAYVPLIYLHQMFTVSGAQPDPCQGIVVIVESEGTGRLGLVVDELLGQQQVVVKSIETNYEHVKGISGATILGNGRVALILDIASLKDMERQNAPHATPASTRALNTAQEPRRAMAAAE